MLPLRVRENSLSLSLSRSVARASQKPCTATLMLACTNFHFLVVSRSVPPLRGETDMRTSRQTHSLEQTRNLQISVVKRTTFRWLTAKKMSVRMMFVSNWHETDRSAPCQLGSRSHFGSLSCLNARSVHWFLPTCLLAVLKILLSCTFQDRHSLWTRGPARRGFSLVRGLDLSPSVLEVTQRRLVSSGTRLLGPSPVFCTSAPLVNLCAPQLRHSRTWCFHTWLRPHVLSLSLRAIPRVV